MNIDVIEELVQKGFSFSAHRAYPDKIVFQATYKPHTTQCILFSESSVFALVAACDLFLEGEGV